MMNELWADIISWTVNGDTWIIYVFLIVTASLTVNFVQKRFLNRLHQRFLKTNNPWDDALVLAAQRPLTWMIWLLGLKLAVDVIQYDNKSPVFEVIEPLQFVAAILILTLFLLGLIRQIETVFKKKEDKQGKKKYEAATVEAVSKLLRASAIITGVLVALQTLGFSISGVLAFGGIGGVAIGFAAKDLLANFFGGLIIYLDRPFAVGDWIRSSDREIEGVVETIGWRLTTIRTFDKRPLYIPNSIFSSIAVENPSRMSNRRIYETIGIRYEDSHKIPAIIDSVRSMLQQHDEIDTKQTLIVNFNKFAPSSLDFFIYTFTKTTDWVTYHKIKQAVLLDVLEIIEQHGAEVAFPTSTLHIDSHISEPVL
ncbi:MAG: mechanosensitive ion channel family protein [Gammaproteobacteria bacterium]|nr:mechanosensitive ion channel family protein [Gammaproteobacteria bacterium]